MIKKATRIGRWSSVCEKQQNQHQQKMSLFFCICFYFATCALSATSIPISSIQVSSTLGAYVGDYLFDDSRGRQSQTNYWNDGSNRAYPDTVTLNFMNVAPIASIILQAPIMDISGPYLIRNISIAVRENNVWIVVEHNLQLYAASADSSVTDTQVFISGTRYCTGVQITFGSQSGNVDGWNFLGEVRLVRKMVTVEESIAYLSMTSAEMIRDSIKRMKSGALSFAPQVGSAYNAFWLRDFAYMVEGNPSAFSFDELFDTVHVFMRGQRSDGAMVDSIAFDGTPYYMPGYGTMGANPVADGSQFAVHLIWKIYQYTRNVPLLQQYANALILAMQVVPRSSSGLVYISPIGWDRCPYGFTDQIRKQGDQLFDSLLYVQACRELSSILATIGRPTDAQSWQITSNSVASQINAVFWDGSIGLYRAATLQCNQPDIWGSAFAVRLGIPSASRRSAIANYFRNNYAFIVNRGQLRHLPGNTFWQVTSAPANTFQNGAFWGVPVGWFAYTVDFIDAGLANATILNMVNDFATRGIKECISDIVNGVPDYVASAALPIEGIKAMMNRRAGL